MHSWMMKWMMTLRMQRWAMRLLSQLFPMLNHCPMLKPCDVLAEEGKHAALEELNAHSTNGTWKLVPQPPGKKVIGSKWVFKVKHNADGSIEGRVVAKGYNQCPGFDYIKIFAPTVRMPTIRVVLAISALHDYHLCSIDISHAYLNGEMDCDVYMVAAIGSLG
jgi:hypothetical protein